MGHAWRMSYERLWERLFDFLNGWSTAAETEPGRIEVVVENSEGSSRVVEILMTRDEWDDMVAIPWGDFELATQEVRKAVFGLRYHERFLVYGQYELVPSATPSLPFDLKEARLNELARQHPEACGRRAVTNRDGNGLDQCSPPPD
jgi:hypothetical protein